MFHPYRHQNYQRPGRYLVLFTLLVIVMSSKTALGCALGFSFKFEKLPQNALLVPQGADPVAEFMNEKFGKAAWRPSRGQLMFKTLKVIENSSSIPLTFGSKSPDQTEKIDTIELYQTSLFGVVEFPKTKAAQTKAVNNMFPSQVPISSNIQLGPSKPRQITAKTVLSAQFHLNRDSDAPLVLPSISIRVKAPASTRRFQAFAVFYPADKKRLPILAKSKQLPVHGCETLYFVKGAWPENLLSSYEYN